MNERIRRGEVDIRAILDEFLTRGHHGAGKHIRAKKPRGAYGSTGPRDTAKRAEWLKTDAGKAYAARQAAKKPVTPRAPREPLSGGASFTGKFAVKEWDEYEASDRAEAALRRGDLVKRFGAETFGAAAGAKDFSAKELARLVGVPDGATVIATGIYKRSVFTVDPDAVAYEVAVQYKHPNLSWAASRTLTVETGRQVTMSDVMRRVTPDPLRQQFVEAAEKYEREFAEAYAGTRGMSKTQLIAAANANRRVASTLSTSDPIADLRRAATQAQVGEHPAQSRQFREVVDGPRPQYSGQAVTAAALADAPVVTTMTCKNERGSRAAGSPPGFQMECLSQQASALSKAGFTSISTETAGSGSATKAQEARAQAFRDRGFTDTFDPPKMSYYAQAKAGYDAAITEAGAARLGLSGASAARAQADLQSALKTRLRGTPFAGAQTVGDIMRAPGGAQWWRDNGESTAMTFDLRPGADSLKVLAAYTRERRAAIKRGDASVVAPPMPK